MSIKEWEQNFIDLDVNFTFPLEVSNGKFKDRIEVNVKNPSMFISEASKMQLDKKFTKLVKEIPA